MASAAVAGLLMPLLAKGHPVTASAPGGTTTVVIKQMRFDPAELNVKPGDTVVWKNEDIFAHTVTSDDGRLDSGLIEPGKSWETTVQWEGALKYHCRPHPNMRASLQLSEGNDHEARSQSHEQHGTESLALELPRAPQQIHPILVNFTAALVPLAFLSDLLGLLLRRRSLHHAATWMMLYAAAITPVTVAAGWWWKLAGDSDVHGKLIMVHQWLGTFAALIFIALAIWRWGCHRRGVPPNLAYLIVLGLAVLALVYQGSLGGKMAFGI
jgi:plastocyanin/uncharacterized membrane protein